MLRLSKWLRKSYRPAIEPNMRLTRWSDLSIVASGTGRWPTPMRFRPDWLTLIHGDQWCCNRRKREPAVDAAKIAVRRPQSLWSFASARGKGRTVSHPTGHWQRVPMRVARRSTGWRGNGILRWIDLDPVAILS